MSQIGYFERVKIQAEILLPLFRRLREAIGEPRACELVRDAVREFATTLVDGAFISTDLPPLCPRQWRPIHPSSGRSST